MEYLRVQTRGTAFICWLILPHPAQERHLRYILSEIHCTGFSPHSDRALGIASTKVKDISIRLALIENLFRERERERESMSLTERKYISLWQIQMTHTVKQPAHQSSMCEFGCSLLAQRTSTLATYSLCASNQQFASLFLKHLFELTTTDGLLYSRDFAFCSVIISVDVHTHYSSHLIEGRTGRPHSFTKHAEFVQNVDKMRKEVNPPKKGKWH